MTHREHLVQADRLIDLCLDRIARQRRSSQPSMNRRALKESLRAFEKHRQYIVNRLNDAERS
jgi:predicted transcriptional regulator